MLLLSIDAGILFMITISLGVLFHLGLEKIMRAAVRTDLLGTFLAGSILSAVYFNLVSFCFPVDYWTLLPLAAVSILTFIRFGDRYHDLFSSVTRQLHAIRPWLIPFICLSILLFLYGIKPPTNPDSVDYHFLSILWGEKYKVVHGLANLFQPYAYNPASFIIQSAYSFTNLAGQSLYPLNEVLTALFFFWILARVYTYRTSLRGLIYFLFLIISYRYLLGNLSSPTQDPLFQICLYYSLIKICESLISGETGLAQLLLPSIILLFAPTAKLSACPALLPFLFVFFMLQKKCTGLRLPLFLTFMAIMIYIPWMGRNYISSGYLAYPYPYLDLFHPDWKVPILSIKEGWTLLYNSPRMLPQDESTLASQGPIAFSKWIFPLIFKQFSSHLYFGLAVTGAALISPLLWALLKIRKMWPAPPLFFFWLTLYSCCWLWLINAPDYRYGIPFLTVCSIIPMLILSEMSSGKKKAFLPDQKIFSLLFILTTAYYVNDVMGSFRNYSAKRTEPFTWKEIWLTPLKDVYYRASEKDSFPYKTLKEGVKLYLANDTHLCINAGAFCAYYDSDHIPIEMRGDSIEDGFRPIDLYPPHLP